LPADTAQERDGDLGISVRIFQGFDFRQAAVGDCQLLLAVAYAGKRPLRDLGPGLLDPGSVEIREADAAFQHLEVAVVFSLVSRERSREMDAQAVVSGIIFDRGADIQARHAMGKGNEAGNAGDGFFSAARFTVGGQGGGSGEFQPQGEGLPGGAAGDGNAL
jgi:hypothetical protein